MDRVLVNMPLIMSRRVLVQQEDGSMAPDFSWHQSVRAMYLSLYAYLQERGLLDSQHQRVDDFNSLVLRESDFSSIGLIFWRSGAVSRWLGSFDRSPGKKLDNYQILDKALRQIQGAA